MDGSLLCHHARLGRRAPPPASEQSGSGSPHAQRAAALHGRPALHPAIETRRSRASLPPRLCRLQLQIAVLFFFFFFVCFPAILLRFVKCVMMLGGEARQGWEEQLPFNNAGGSSSQDEGTAWRSLGPHLSACVGGGGTGGRRAGHGRGGGSAGPTLAIRPLAALQLFPFSGELSRCRVGPWQ